MWANVGSAIRAHIQVASFSVCAWIALVVALSFAVGALLVYVGQQHGPIAACGAGSLIFALIAAAAFVASRIARSHRSPVSPLTNVTQALVAPSVALLGARIVRSAPLWLPAFLVAAGAAIYVVSRRRAK